MFNHKHNLEIILIHLSLQVKQLLYLKIIIFVQIWSRKRRFRISLKQLVFHFQVKKYKIYYLWRTNNFWNSLFKQRLHVIQGHQMICQVYIRLNHWKRFLNSLRLRQMKKDYLQKYMKKQNQQIKNFYQL